MNKGSLFALLLCGALLTTGCASKNNWKHYAMRMRRCVKPTRRGASNWPNAMRIRSNLRHRLSDEQRRVDDLRKDYQLLQGSLDKSLQQNSQGSINISKLVDEINASNRFIKQLVEAKSKSDSLNMVLTNNLTRSLSNDELKEVDVKVLKGVVYISLADNMLYKSGSYEINSRAKETLSKIAKIIKDYRDYDVLVEGNTDPVPITRTNIRNNWDLSCLRASSVVLALQNDYGVNPARLTAAGRGEYNPRNYERNGSGQAAQPPHADHHHAEAGSVYGLD